MPEDKGVAPAKVRFGVFEVDLRAGELRKSGNRIRLQGQPFKVLAMLLERPNEVVTRDELRERVWGSDTTVDFDHGLGTAINKVREALGDSADQPRYVETLARRGFRFIAPVSLVPVVNSLDHPSDNPVNKPSVVKFAARRRATKRFALWGITGLTLTAAVALLPPWYGSSPIGPLSYRRLTWSDRVYPGDLTQERFSGLAVAGGRIYFSQVRNGRFSLASTSIFGGEPETVVLPPEILRPMVADVSADGSKLLIRSLIWSEIEQPFWIIASAGGAARKVPGIVGHDAAWMPDGHSIVYSSGQDLLISGEGGLSSRKLATVSGRAFWIRYSPDGGHLRFTIVDSATRKMSLWQLDFDGQNLRPLLSDWREREAACCGSWTDDRSFVFQTTTTDSSNLWMLEESRRLLSPHPSPIPITHGPLRYLSAAPAASAGRIFAIGAHDRDQLHVVNPMSHKTSPFLPQLNALRASFSRDGRWVAWISTEDGSLWRGRVDGSERLQLVGSPLRIGTFRWDAEGRRIAFSARKSGGVSRIYIVSADGGVPLALIDEQRNQVEPTWSADGKSIAFGRLADYLGEPSLPKSIEIVDVNSKTVRTLPGSAGLLSPRWSPKGSFLAAISLDQTQLHIFNFASQEWTVLRTGNVSRPEWTSDERYIYYRSRVEADPLYRISMVDGKVEAVMDFNDFETDAVIFAGLSPEDEPLVAIHSSSGNIYAIDWHQ